MQVEFRGRSIEVAMWDGGTVPLEPLVGMDTETLPIEPGQPLVPATLQVYFPNTGLVLLTQGKEKMYDLFEKTALSASSPMMAWHNWAFDWEVLGGLDNPVVRDCTERGKIIDTGLRYLLKKMADGTWIDIKGREQLWSLDHITNELLGVKLDKNPEIRLSFRPDIVLSEEQIRYAALDPVATAECAKVMPAAYATEQLQILGAIVLSSIGRRGLLVDRKQFDMLRDKFQKEQEKYDEILYAFGYHRKTKNVNAVLQALLANIEMRTGIRFPRTAGGTPKDGKPGRPPQICVKKEILQLFPDRTHPFLSALKKSDHVQKMLSTFLNEKLIGPDGRVHPTFESLKVTGRVSCRRPNIQNPPRGDGIRGQYVAPAGKSLYIPDYSQLELCTLAQDCYIRQGKSKLRDLINAGVDVHSWMGEQIRQRSSSESGIYQELRALGKTANFGLPGGMGAEKLIQYAKTTYDLDITLDEAKQLRTVWLESYPEMAQHLRPAEDPRNQGWYLGETLTGRTRARSPYCASCNVRFQGLAADGAKLVMWDLYCERFEIVNFVHDEFLFELLLNQELQQKIRRIDQIMVEGMQKVTPDVKISTEGCLVLRWNKKAKPCYDSLGNLMVWTEDIVCPKKKDDPLYQLSKEEVLQNCPAGHFPLWSHDGKHYGWQPEGSVVWRPEV